MEKIMCPHCYHIYEVEEERGILTCPKCGKESDFAASKKMLQYVITRYMNDGIAALNEDYDTKKAINCYTKLLEIEVSEDYVYYLIEALIKGSKVRSDHFDEILGLLNKHNDLLKPNEDNKLKINDYLYEIMTYLDQYRNNLHKILIQKDKFVNFEVKFIYKNKLTKIREIMDFLYSNLFNIDFTEDALITRDDLVDTIKEVDEEIDKEYGILEESKYVLEESENHILIKDDVFPDGSRFREIKRRLTILSALSILVIITGIILMFAVKDNIFTGVIVLGVGALGFIAAFLIRTLINKSIK